MAGACFCMAIAAADTNSRLVISAPVLMAHPVGRAVSIIMRLMRRLLTLLLACTMVAAAAPPVLVIALDGFRHDFAEREKTPALLALKREGASVEGLIPSFPSTTFPNFHSM